MFLKFKMTDGSALYVSKATDGGALMENYTGAGTDESKCVWAHYFTAEQMTELKNFLASQGF